MPIDTTCVYGPLPAEEGGAVALTLGEFVYRALYDEQRSLEGARVRLAGLRTLTSVWRGDRSWADALRSGAMALHGQPPACRALPRWLKLSSLARAPRPAAHATAGGS